MLDLRSKAVDAAQELKMALTINKTKSLSGLPSSGVKCIHFSRMKKKRREENIKTLWTGPWEDEHTDLAHLTKNGLGRFKLILASRTEKFI